MLTTRRLCARIIRLLHAPIYVYKLDGSRSCVYIDHGEQQHPLDCDPALLEKLLDRGRREAPILHLEANEMIYGLVRDEAELYILGPCCLGQDPILAAKYLVRAHSMNPKKPYRVSAVSVHDFEELTLCLYEQLTDQTMEQGELLLKSFCNPNLERSMRERLHRVFHEFRESGAVHNPYAQELREQESIRAGDLEGLYRSINETYVGKLGTLATDLLRHEKNMTIVIITLASRSAMAGGVLPEVAYSMSDAFIQRTEEVQSVAEAIALARQAEVEFCTAVHKLSSGGPVNALIPRCKALIVQQLHTRLSVKDLAAQLEVTPDYLSRIFAKTEGMKLTDYITREKIAFAKKHLVYTDDSYRALAFTLGFASQSHFGQAFKKWTGMTPKQFRERNGKPLKEN